MPTTHTYRPLISQNPAKILRIDTDNMRRFPARHGVSSPVQPLKGLWETRAASISYRALAPGGAGFCYRICTGTSESRPTAHYSLLTANSTFTFSAKERDSETGLSYFGSRYYSSDLSIWLSVDPMARKYPSLSPYVYCADNPVKLVDPDGEEIGEPPLKRIVNLGFQSKTFQKLFRKSGLTIENMSDIISFGNQSFINPYTKKITLRDANSDMGNVIALTHEMTNRIHAKKLKNNMESVRKGDISYETFADNAIRIESEGVANQIIVASELNYSFPDDKGVMNDLKTQYKEGTIRRREMLNTIKDSDFQDEFGRNPKKDYYEQGKNIRESQIRREKQSKSGF